MMSLEEKRRKAREKAARWRANNPERAREVRLLSQRRRRGNMNPSLENLPRNRAQPKTAGPRPKRVRPTEKELKFADLKARFMGWRESKLRA